MSPTRLTRPRQGALLCLVSATGFGAMPVLAQLGYDAGLDVASLLAIRFTLAAVMLWAVVAVRRTPLRGIHRGLALGLTLGGTGYALQAGLFFAALERVDAALASLLLYAYPAFVTLAGIAVLGDRPERRRWLALGAATVGIALVLGGGGRGADPLGLALALGAGLAYSVYILGSDRMMRGVDPVAFAAAVCTGSAAVVTGVGLGAGTLALPPSATAWLVIAAIALLCTVVAIVGFFAGMARVGPSKAAILSTVEPPVTVVLALVAFGDALGPSQVLGGALVLSGAVLVVERSGRRWRRGDAVAA